MTKKNIKKALVASVLGAGIVFGGGLSSVSYANEEKPATEENIETKEFKNTEHVISSFEIKDGYVSLDELKDNKISFVTKTPWSQIKIEKFDSASGNWENIYEAKDSTGTLKEKTIADGDKELGGLKVADLFKENAKYRVSYAYKVIKEDKDKKPLTSIGVSDYVEFTIGAKKAEVKPEVKPETKAEDKKAEKTTEKKAETAKETAKKELPKTSAVK